jgi:hypothetical protein
LKNIIHFSHANGFPASTYRTIFAELADDYDVRFIERIGHDTRFPVTQDWPHLVEQLLDDISRSYEQPVWLVGHMPRMTKFVKYVFVTGGVVSSLGKGIAAASLAAILESRGLKVTLIKLDPYINVDPGTMSRFSTAKCSSPKTARRPTSTSATTSASSARDEGQQLHHGQIYKSVLREGAPRRLSRQDRAGDPAHHQRDPGLRRARRGIGDVR